MALVTGGARGIGRATARLLAQRGAAVCVNYAAHADAADRLAGEIVAGGGRAISAMADVAEPSAVEAVVARAEKELGSVTILVNNAGVSWRGTLDTYDLEQVSRMRRVNAEGLIHATRAVIGGMRARRYGRIVNISSIAAIGTGLPGNAFYAATKAEVAILTKRFAMELGPHNITVNAVAPGFVRTDMTQLGRGAGDWQGLERVPQTSQGAWLEGRPADHLRCLYRPCRERRRVLSQRRLAAMHRALVPQHLQSRPLDQGAGDRGDAQGDPCQRRHRGGTREGCPSDREAARLAP